MTRTHLRIGALAPVLCLFAFPLLADIYRCEQETGHISYQQFPCRGQGDVLQLNTPRSGWSALRPGERRLLESYRRKEAAARRTLPTKPSSSAEASSKTCWHKRKTLAALRARLRRGYGIKEGASLRRRRDDAADYLRQFCP